MDPTAAPGFPRRWVVTLAAVLALLTAAAGGFYYFYPPGPPGPENGIPRVYSGIGQEGPPLFPPGVFFWTQGVVKEVKPDKITIAVSSEYQDQGAPAKVTGLISAETKLVRLVESLTGPEITAIPITLQDIQPGRVVILTRAEGENDLETFRITRVAIAEDLR